MGFWTKRSFRWSVIKTRKRSMLPSKVEDPKSFHLRYRDTRFVVFFNRFGLALSKYFLTIPLFHLGKFWSDDINVYVLEVHHFLFDISAY